MGEQRRILLAEDSLTQAVKAKFLLEKHDYDVSLAKNGAEALDRLQEARPALIISDIVMPEMDGFELCRRVKTDDQFKDIPIILLTSLSETKDVLKGLSCGANSFVPKPYEEKVLLSQIEYILSKVRQDTNGDSELNVETEYQGETYAIRANANQVLDFLLQAYEMAQKSVALERANRKLSENDLKLRLLNDELEERVKQKTAAFMEENRERWKAAEALQKSNATLRAVSEMQSKFISEDNPAECYEGLLSTLVRVTQSEYGFIAEVAQPPGDPLEFVSFTVVGIGQSEEFRDFYENDEIPGRMLRTLGRIHGEIIRKGKPVLSNDAGTASQYGEIPEGHPPLNAFLALPLLSSGALVGIAAVANRAGGYDENMMTYLQPLLGGSASMIDAMRNVKRRKEAEERVRQEATRAEALVRTAAHLSTGLDFEAVVNTVCKEAAGALNVPIALLALEDDQRGGLYYVGGVGLPTDFDDNGQEAHWAVFETQGKKASMHAIVPDVQAVADLSGCELFSGLNLRTGAAAKMVHEGRMIGALFIFTVDEPRGFTANELGLLKGLADQAALAIANARRYQEAQQRLEQLGALHAIDLAISASSDMRLTYKIILEQITSSLHVDAAEILLFNSETQILEYAAAHGFRGSVTWRPRVQLGDGPIGNAALERSTVHIPDLASADLAFSNMIEDEGFVSCRAVPLVAKGELKGVLVLFHRAPLKPDREWKKFLESVSGRAAIAVDNASQFSNQQRSTAALNSAYDATIEAWAKALDLRDVEADGHCRHVTELTLRLARRLGIGESELLHIRRGALLHDVGMMDVPDNVLFRLGPPGEEDQEILREHPVYAYQMLSPITHLRPALDIPYCHHENWDGTGYPRGLKSEEIPLPARIFSVAHAWDKLCSQHADWPAEKKFEQIRTGASSLFDPQIVDKLLEVVRDETS